MRCPEIHELPPPPPGKTGWPWTEGTPQHLRASSSRKLPLISIVTPSFNQGHLLEETMRSVLLQGYPNLEFFIVDGSSSDDSVEVIKKYQKFVTWWVSEADFGQSNAINKGFARAMGAVRGFLNSDDVYEPGALHAVAAAMADGEQWIVGQVRYLNEEGRTWPLAAYPEKSVVQWFLHCPVPQPGSFWTSSLHALVGEFREDLRYYFDYDFWMRLRFQCKRRPRVIPQTLAVYRLHSASKTMSDNKAFTKEARIVCARYLAELTQYERVKLAIARYRKRACHFGSRAKAKFAAGEKLSALGLMAIGILRWPPLIIDKRIVAIVNRLATGRSVIPADEPPVVWNVYED